MVDYAVGKERKNLHWNEERKWKLKGDSHWQQKLTYFQRIILNVWGEDDDK
jgi:hypothetical protein